LALLPAGARAQGGGTVSGRVVDAATQAPIQEAQVVVAGTQRGAATDAQGRFSIPGVPAGTYTIRARRIGYAQGEQQVTVGAGATATANFSLATAATQLQEVVVNAVTGAQERRVEVGTNVGHVNVGDLNKGPITKMADVLQSRVAGVTLQSPGGATGAGQRIRVRGANSLSLSNEPLLFLDGVLVSNGKGGINVGGGDYSRLNDLNPEEIQNIEVLKGPAASAIYGSAASNGVLLITTKRGRAGRPQWRAYAEAGSLEDKNEYPLNYAALSRNDATSTEYFNSEFDPPYQYLNTTFLWSLFGLTGAPFATCHNYQAAIAAGSTGACKQDVALSFDQLRDKRTTPFVTGSRDKLGLSVSGGSEALTYFLSGDREAENGVLRPNNLERISLRTNLNARIGSKATAAITGAYITSKHRRLGESNSIFSPILVAFHGPAQYIPGMETDTLGFPASRVASLFGPNYADQKNNYADQGLDRFIIGANTNYTPLSWLRINGNAGLDYYGRVDQQSLDPGVLPIDLTSEVGYRDAYRASNYLWTTNASAAATWNPTSALVSTTTLGASFSRALFEQINCSGIGIPAGTTSCSATTSQFAVDETHTDEKSVGAFVRQELAFGDRFFVSGSLRADNNSGLVRDVSGLSYYPSFNASWVASQEKFFPQTNFLSQLRLRAGWGQAGQRPGFGQAESFFGSRAIQLAGSNLPALVLTSTGNPALKVERTTELEGGFDLGLFDDRVNTEFTVFTRVAKDALVSRNLQPSSGLTGAVFQNLGKVKNSGMELGLNVAVLQRNNFDLDLRLTAATLKNRIEELGEGIAPIQLNRGEQQHREGFSAGGYFARPYKYNDANGDGKLAVSEVQVDSSKFLVVPDKINGGLDTLALEYMGPVLPTNSQGFGADLTVFKNITISTLFERRAGNKQLNESEYFRCRTQFSNPYYGFCGGLADPNATLEAQAAFIASTFSSDPVTNAATGFGATPYGYIQDADFVKWRELSVRLGVPESWGTRVRPLRGASISLSGRNLKTWTNYTGLDPETNETGGSNFNQAEFNTQPPVRTFTLRFDFKL
jgi:TonB-linked SusC/RagA family outer membrane protein